MEQGLNVVLIHKELRLDDGLNSPDLLTLLALVMHNLLQETDDLFVLGATVGRFIRSSIINSLLTASGQAFVRQIKW